MTETQIADLSDDALMELAENHDDPLIRELAWRWASATKDREPRRLGYPVGV